VTLDPLQGIELDLKPVIAYLGSKDERGALPKVASRDAQPDDAAFPMASAQRFGHREVPFAAELHNNVFIIRSNALSAGKAKLRQVFAVEVTFENRARDLSGSHDYLLAQGRSAHDYHGRTERAGGRAVTALRSVFRQEMPGRRGRLNLQNDHDVQIAKRDLGKTLDRIETVNKPKAAKPAKCNIAGSRKFADALVRQAPAPQHHGEAVVPIFIDRGAPLH
jgi:hypothetical protein